MELKIDDLFKELFNIYYAGEKSETILNEINNYINKFDKEILIDSVNLVKTSSIINEDFSKCYCRINDRVKHKFPADEDISLFILSVVLRVLVSQGASNIKNLFVAPRNILREVAAKFFRVPEGRVTHEMIEEVKARSTENDKDAYSVDDPIVNSWDEYYYNICRQVARNSKCLSRRIGAVLVKDKSIISTGYNGPPRGVPRCDFRWQIDSEFREKYKDFIKDREVEGVCPRHIIGFKSGEGLDVCPAGHAERNALINAARHGISTKGALLYMTCGIPCTPCLIEIINAGIEEIIVGSLKTYDETSKYLLNNSSLKVRLYDFAK